MGRKEKIIKERFNKRKKTETLDSLKIYIYMFKKRNGKGRQGNN